MTQASDAVQAMPGAKVPSVVWYDSQGQAKAHGAETEDEDIVDQADLNGWQKAEWYDIVMHSHASIFTHAPLPQVEVTYETLSFTYHQRPLS
jgi:hypothetical protein